MLFGSLFKRDKATNIGNGKKRKLTIQSVIDRLNSFEFTAANCTLIRDHLGNDKIENYGQVDVFRLRDEEVFTIDNTFCITTPTGVQLKADVGGNMSSIVSPSEHETDHPVEDFDEDENEDAESDEDANESPTDEAQVHDVDPDTVEETLSSLPEGQSKKGQDTRKKSTTGGGDAYSERQTHSDPNAPEQEEALGMGQVIRLRFFFLRRPYEIDCQITDRFNPSRIKGDIDLTPRFGEGYRVRPLTDVRNRDKRRYIRYSHRKGFGNLRVRNEIQFHVYAHRTNIEIPERGTLKPVLTHDDYKTIPYGTQAVEEIKGKDKLEDFVEFFKRCMVDIPTEHRYVYLSKGYFDTVRRKSSLVGLGPYATVGAQQTTISPKIYIKKPMKGKTVLEKMVAEKVRGPRDPHKMRIIEGIQDRYSLSTRELKTWQARRRQKRVENYENDIAQVSFFSSYGTSSQDIYPMRVFTMNCELVDVGLENLTLKPLPFEDSRSRELEEREFIRQEDGFPVDLLTFSVGGAQVRGGKEEYQHQAFLNYLGGDGFAEMGFEQQVEALQNYAVLLHFYPVLTFTRSQIQDYEPYLPFQIPVIARVARFRTALNTNTQNQQIVSVGLDFIYNPGHDAYSRDLNLYDEWEQITPYTENSFFIEIHRSLQLLFGFDGALDEDLGNVHAKEKKQESSDDGADTSETS